HGAGSTGTGSLGTSTASTASACRTTSWSTWKTRFVPAGGKAGFGIYSGLTRRPATMSRMLMAAENRETQPPTPQLSAERPKALNLAITQIEKTCGKGAIMRMGADAPRVPVAVVATGALDLDAAVGSG